LVLVRFLIALIGLFTFHLWMNLGYRAEIEAEVTGRSKFSLGFLLTNQYTAVLGEFILNEQYHSMDTQFSIVQE
jgi:hypothetical protein